MHQYMKTDVAVVFDRYIQYPTEIHALTSRSTEADTKNWWFVLNDVKVGYWPKELFSNLEGGVRGLFFGGVATADENHNYPQMGFGKFPGSSIKEAGFMRHIKDLQSSGKGIDISGLVVQTSPSCYNVGDVGFKGADEFVVLFGGPGGSPCQ
ncbi:hypothetical protein MLD38_019313 [Melastoma candidum]|uniref:Uncharacterized protein n=1 Tax=Melastoma candidum TaxID=119954 RepID=A0ACB9QYH6_9MYRT|nr:hypothetical protein MLD38_019313 [Melastoma candidum]